MAICEVLRQKMASSRASSSLLLAASGAILGRLWLGVPPILLGTVKHVRLGGSTHPVSLEALVRAANHVKQGSGGGLVVHPLQGYVTSVKLESSRLKGWMVCPATSARIVRIVPLAIFALDAVARILDVVSLASATVSLLHHTAETVTSVGRAAHENAWGVVATSPGFAAAARKGSMRNGMVYVPTAQLAGTVQTRSPSTA